MASLSDRLKTLEGAADPSGYRIAWMQPGESAEDAAERYRREAGYQGTIVPMDETDRLA